MEPKTGKPFRPEHRRSVGSAPSGREFGLLEVLAYLIAIVMVVGSFMSGWNFNLLIALIMLVVLYAIFRDVRTLAGLKSGDGRNPVLRHDSFIPASRARHEPPTDNSIDPAPTARDAETRGIDRTGVAPNTRCRKE